MLANTMRSLVRLPFVVGAEWFQYYDEPPYGRFDGEDYNFGLVDIHDRPYEEVTQAFVALMPVQTQVAEEPVRPDAAAGVPPAPDEPLADFEFMRALKSWDRERGFVPAASPAPVGDLYVCWSPEAIYLGIYILDVADGEHYRDRKVPLADRGQWRIRIGDAKPFTLRVGYGEAPEASDPSLRFKSLSGVNHKVRSIAAVEIPAERLGTNRLQPGDHVEIDASYVTHGGVRRIDWRGSYPLSE